MKEVKEYKQLENTRKRLICAPFPYLTTLVSEAKGRNIKIAAQTMHFEENGAFTGEVSPMMLKDIGVSHVSPWSFGAS